MSESTYTLKGAEIECIKRLAAMYEAGELYWRTPGQWELLGLTEQNYVQVLTLMESVGVIREQNKTNMPFRFFEIRPSAVQAARQIAETEQKQKEGKDLVESLKTTVRKHPVYAWVVIVFLVFTAVMTALSQTTTFLKNVGVIGDKPTPPPAAQPG